jgi:growth factor-regulated tyrosine kinase substrate
MDFLGLSFVLNPHDEAFERATSENIPVGTDDIQQSLAIADRVKGKEIPAKLAIQSLKKRLLHRNPNVQILTLKLIDVLVKNCGIHFHIELCSKDFYDCLCAIGSDV